MKNKIRFLLWKLLGISYYTFLKNQNVTYLNDCRKFQVGFATYNNGAKVWKWGGNSDLKIGKYCSIANDVNFILDSGFHDFFKITPYPLIQNLYKKDETLILNGVSTTKGDIKSSYPNILKKIEVGNDVWIGANVTILPGVKIGNCCTILAGAIVTKSFDDFSIIAGIPAVKIGERIEKSLQEKFLEIAWWNWSEEKIKNYINDFNLSNLDFIKKHSNLI